MIPRLAMGPRIRILKGKSLDVDAGPLKCQFRPPFQGARSPASSM